MTGERAGLSGQRRVGIGFVGAGFVAHIHARAYQRLADLGAQVVAVAAVPLGQAEELARDFGIPNSYEDYRCVLERPDVDIVDLCVPNALHEPFTIQALQAGKHVICEKPLAGYFGGPGASDPVGLTPKRVMLESAIASAGRMVKAVHGSGRRLMYAENWLYAPAVRKVARLAEASGGTILEMRGQECHSGSHAGYAKTWRIAGGGALLRLGAHPLGAMIHLKWQEGLRRSGQPILIKSVTAEVGDLTRVESFVQERQKWLVTGWEDVENWATAVVTFADGSRGTVFASDIALGGMEDTFEVFLSNGRVVCDMSHSTLLRTYAPAPEVFASEYFAEKLETKAGWSYPSIDEEWMLGYHSEFRDFVEAVVLDRDPVSTPEIGLEVVKAVYAAYVSAEEGRRVDL